MNSNKRGKILVVGTLLGLVMYISFVQAETMDITNCSSGITNVLISTDELTIMTTDVKGITRDNLDSKIFDNMTYHCVGLFKVMGGKRYGTTNCKFMSPDGDFFVVEASYGPEGGTAPFLHGTGKFKGITGNCVTKPITSGKPIVPGTTQGCARVTGNYELKK
ncbi:MAG: hypothetical protein QME83_10650 [Thermodesulfobacteriota bacterium]|nr:hypothetical protein [Thermodesulfobacteriota bacterium]